MRDGCKKYTEDAPTQPRDPPEKLITARYPFQYIVADFFEIKSTQFLVIVDRFSSWPIVYKFAKANSFKLMKCMRKIFETYGVPQVLTSDGGTQFTSAQFSDFLKFWELNHHQTAASYTHSNLRAEVRVGS